MPTASPPPQADRSSRDKCPQAIYRRGGGEMDRENVGRRGRATLIQGRHGPFSLIVFSAAAQTSNGGCWTRVVADAHSDRRGRGTRNSQGQEVGQRTVRRSPRLDPLQWYDPWIVTGPDSSNEAPTGRCRSITSRTPSRRACLPGGQLKFNRVHDVGSRMKFA